MSIAVISKFCRIIFPISLTWQADCVRETALQNTQLALGRVLDTYGSGRKRDYKRLVPFVANSVRPGTAVSGKMY
jgi:hypothetical protein